MGQFQSKEYDGDPYVDLMRALPERELIWYEDVLHEGNLDEDTPHEDGPPPSPQETGPIAEYDRQKRKYPELIQALMQRYGGHPYETMDMLPFNVVDPVKKTPLENLWYMGHNRNELPPELHPYNFPELLVLPFSPLKELDNEIRMETLICRNLDAALQDSRKPYVFEATAGTVPCSACGGVPWTAHWMPNMGKIFHMEVPMWQRVLGRMSRFATQPRRLADAESRHFLEYPQQDPSVGALQEVLVQELEGPPGPQQARGAKGRAVNKGARASLVGGVDSSEDPAYLNAWGVRGLSRDNLSSSSPDDNGQQVQLSTGTYPLGNVGGPLARAASSSSSVNGRPDKAAAFITDMTRLRQAQGTAAEWDVVQQLQQRYSPAAVQAMLAS
eukprot:gene13088-13215_t